MSARRPVARSRSRSPDDDLSTPRDRIFRRPRTRVTMGVWEDAEPGVRRRILVAQGRLMLMEVQFAAGSAGYEHQHPHEQISYCVSGRFEYSLDGYAQVLSAGESVYVPGNVRHGAKALDEGMLI